MQSKIIIIIVIPAFKVCLAKKILPLHFPARQIETVIMYKFQGLTFHSCWQVVRFWISSCCPSGQREPAGSHWFYSPQQLSAGWQGCRRTRFYLITPIWVQCPSTCSVWSEYFTSGTVTMTWCESYFLLVCENISDNSEAVWLHLVHSELWQKCDRSERRQRLCGDVCYVWLVLSKIGLVKPRGGQGAPAGGTVQP